MGCFCRATFSAFETALGKEDSDPARVGQEETSVELSLAVEYGRPILRISVAVLHNAPQCKNRVENLMGLRVPQVNITVNDILLSEEWQREVGRQAREQMQQT